jgi:ubiquinone/menaquinone biosynthesis C-methylase UbiE
LTSRVAVEEDRKRTYIRRLVSTSTLFLDRVKQVTGSIQDDNGAGWEYRDRDYWETTYRFYLSQEGGLHSNAVTEGNDGEREFDEEMLNAAVGKRVLDVGCGDGSFTIRIAERGAKNAVGIDFSKTAICEAQENLARSGMKRNVRFALSEADRLPFAGETFDLVVCRRGPVTRETDSLSEAHRILRKRGVLMEITIGEHNMENIHQIFGRGQTLASEKVSTSRDRMLREAGFKPLKIKEYMATEIFPTVNSLIIRLKNSPIIRNFDLEKDEVHLREVEKSCKTLRGIETQTHRVTIIAQK